MEHVSIPTIAIIPREEIRVIQPPRDLTMEERMSVVGAIISTYGEGTGSHKEIVENIYNVFSLGIPELSALTPAFSSLVTVTVKPSKNDLLLWVGLGDGSYTAEGGKMPVLLGMVKEEAYAVTKMEAVYISMASLLYSIGKQASESARASILDNRPDALIRRFGIQEEDQALLPGKTAGPSRSFLESVYNSFANYTEVRKVITQFFLGVKRGGSHLPLHLEILMTNFQLMRGAGMTHVEAVIKLVQSHPWTLRMPELQPYYRKFTEDLEKFEEVEKDVRPYHRLLVPQSAFLFLSSDLRPLIAVAGSFIEEVEKTYSGYVYNKAQYQGLIDKAHTYAPNYVPTTGLARLADLLNVREEPLPETMGGREAEEEVV